MSNTKEMVYSISLELTDKEVKDLKFLLTGLIMAVDESLKNGEGTQYGNEAKDLCNTIINQL